MGRLGFGFGFFWLGVLGLCAVSPVLSQLCTSGNGWILLLGILNGFTKIQHEEQVQDKIPQWEEWSILYLLLRNSVQKSV